MPSMTRINERKLHWLVSSVPQGIILPTPWLVENGISSKLAWWYVKSGWLEHLDRGAYRKALEVVTWVGAVYSLQTLLNLPIHVGAKTALQLLGRTHYVPLGGIKKIFLFSTSQTKVPMWFVKNDHWDEEFIIEKRKLISDNNTIGIIKYELEKLSINISSPERAILEVMQLIPKHQTYEEAILLMENLSNLRPDVVQALLENCISIKAKRLFLHCADRSEHAWLNKIDLSRIELGSGKRKIADGGVYDPKYQLSVPLIWSKQNDF